jgi:ABC-type transport system involved in cytochrome c biogenesis ATPase subunit
MIFIPSIKIFFDESLHYIAPPLILQKGELIYLSGENGSGKSSYLKALSQFFTQHSYSYVGHDLPYEPRSSLAFLAQAFSLFSSSFMNMKIMSNCALKFGSLSQGQQRLFLLNAILDIQSEIWIIDEGWIHLDEKSLEHVSLKVKNFLNTGGIVIYTDHNKYWNLRPTLSFHMQIQAQ